ncbi:ABC transporter permease [Conexibacter woesei]|uniref:ABC-type Na+ efflux pump permease component-like protein n=1 Tax=Conexibacter woesei (strain DSM 14684 / CCUG 47730 / CIP 108061 / JCM 11494 / NBRC 100937 / ID131577) TaxID=469383 RepID=D3FA95_CONWI|nr:ABC transporter permease [Conexibacter woesei]ADB49164.1 ABC-type Na+ efflux pump permease component- like protein [Conexibacter woesei DSM 14684]
MSDMRWLVARRELVERARSRAFQVGSVIQLLAIVIVLVIAALTGGGNDTKDVGLVGAASEPYAQALQQAGPALDAEIDTRALPNRAAAVKAVEDGDLDAAVIDGREILVEDDPDDTLAAAVQATRRQLALRDALDRAGVPAAQLNAALAPAPLRVAVLEPENEDRGTRQGIAFVAVLLLYLAIFTYGLWVAGGIVEEKSSRVIEVVLSAIRPRELLAGKIIGLGVLGIGQFVLTIAVGLIGASLLSAVDLPNVTIGWAALIGLWFVLGFAFYACLYAVAGALVSRQEDLQSSTGALNMVVIGSYILAFVGIQDPDGTLLTVISFLPPSAPMAMPARWLVTEVPAWQLIVSLLLTLGATVATLRLATTVYARAALRMGPKLSLRSVLATRD